MTKIIYLHVPELKDYMIPTRDFIQRVKTETHFNVIDAVTSPHEENAIWKPFNEHWGTDDIIIIGQDNVPTMVMLYELEACNHIGCVNPCLSYPPSTALEIVIQNQALYVEDSQRVVLPNERPAFIDYAGTGVCKISMALQMHLPLKDNPCSFPMLDSTIERLKKLHVPMFRWHTHYPMHEHMKQKPEHTHLV